jgi:hypothetical protein
VGWGYRFRLSVQRVCLESAREVSLRNRESREQHTHLKRRAGVLIRLRGWARVLEESTFQNINFEIQLPKIKILINDKK